MGVGLGCCSVRRSAVIGEYSTIAYAAQHAAERRAFPRRFARRQVIVIGMSPR
jgi:hypothetical protein